MLLATVPDQQLGLALLPEHQGIPEEARNILAEFEQAERTRYVSPVQKAFVLVGLGRHEEAYALLEQAFEQRIGSLAWATLPEGGQNFNGHLKDPRWPEFRIRILHAIKLPEGANPNSRL